MLFLAAKKSAAFVSLRKNMPVDGVGLDLEGHRAGHAGLGKLRWKARNSGRDRRVMHRAGDGA
jgi:hypothetical protein